MKKLLDQILKFLLVANYLIKCVNNCQFLTPNNYFTNIYEPSIVIETQSSPSIISKIENIGYGVWILYQPYHELGTINKRQFLEMINDDGLHTQQIGQLLYSFTQKSSKKQILVLSQELNENDQSIVHKVFYNFKNGKQTLSFQFNMVGYEGNWILFYFFCNQLEGKTTFGFFQPNLSTTIISQTILDLPEFLDIMIHQSAGLQYYEDENKSFIILNQFKGIVSCVLSVGDADFETSISQCSSNRASHEFCSDEELVLNEFNKDFQGLEYFTKVCMNVQNPKYTLQGWVRLNQLEGIEQETQLIRITINFDYSDDHYLGDRDLLIKYYQNINPQLNGFEIHTYSYEFPQKVRYQTPDELKIKVFGTEYQQVITKWHYIRYDIGNEVENYQPLFQVFFPNFDEIKQFRFPIQIKHFTGTKFLVLLGGDEYSHRNMKGVTYGLVIKYICDEPNPNFTIICHYSCLECFGPTKYHCLSCSTENFRELSVLQNTCNCQSNYIDVENSTICLKAAKAFPHIKLEEIPLNCQIQGYDLCNEGMNQCSFGYFQHENSCIKCPYYEDIYSKTKITCLDCFIAPETFGLRLVCTQEASSFYQNQENAYQIIKRNELEYSYYYIEKTEIGQNSLQLCEGCTKTSCKSGYFQRNKRCVKCFDNCSQCENEFSCQKCIETYYLNFDLICEKCKNCNKCGFEDQARKVVCFNCLDGKEGFPNNDCGTCGNFCQDCDSSYYCNYCVENPKQYYIIFDGKSCSYCNINNCQYCFQYIKMEHYYLTTFDFQFRTYKFFQKDVNQGCALCEPNFYYNFITKKCEIKPQDNNCIFAIIEQNNNQKCIIGSTEDGAIQVSDCIELQFCQQCIKNYFQELSFCIQCMEGYYAGVLSGQCLPCPQQCKSCVQQNIRYKDSWKWDIKAFYKYFINSNGDHSFELFATSNNQLDMEIICTSCPEKYIIHNQKCIFNCAVSCEKCDIILNNAICTKCPIQKNIQLKSQDNQGSCIICPNYCSACIQRSKEDIARINPYFQQNSLNSDSTKLCFEKLSQTDNSYNYFLDSKLFSVNRCQNHKKCQQKVTITNIVYCDNWDFMLSTMFNETVTKIATKALTFFTDDHKQYLESQQIYDYLQEIQPSNIIYEFQFKLGNVQYCQIETGPTNIAVEIQQKIFSIQQVDIKFVGIEKHTRIRIVNELKISNFTNIIFENLEFDFSQGQESQFKQALIKINNLNYNVFLIIKNCVFTTINRDKDFSVTFESQHSYSASIEDVLIQNLRITESKLFSFNSINQQNKGKITIRNLKIMDSDFQHTSFIEFNANTNNYNNELYAENIQITNSQFNNSAFLQSFYTQNFNMGIIKIENFIIEKSIFSKSSFINVKNVKQLTIEKLFVYDLKINQQSQFYQANIIRIMNSKFDKIKLFNNSKLIINQVNLELNIEEQLNSLIENFEIINIEYDSIQSLINIQQQKKLEFYNFELSNNYLIGQLSSNQISFSESAIYIQCQFCILNNIDVIRLNGLPEISIMETEDILMKNIKLIQNDEFHPQMLHPDYSCLQKLQNFEMSFFIYFGKYQKISINNIQISESFTFNSPFLIFQGYDLLEKVKNEYISISDSKFEKNLLLIYREFSSSSILYFDSNQNSEIEILNSEFLNNHLNEYYQNQKMTSATTLAVLQRSGTFKMKNCSFIENVVTNSSDSILYVQSDIVSIKNIIFQNNNMIEYLDFSRNLLWSIENQQTFYFNDLQNIFQVKSYSGNGIFNIKNFIAENVLINQSYAYSSGGFRFIQKGQSSVVINNSQFYNTRTTLDSTIFSQGGCFYVDASSSSSLSFNLFNILIDTSYSRTEGGGIYIIPTNTLNFIHFKNLTIRNCFAIKNSFISYQLQKLNQIVSSFVLEQTQFFQDELSFNYFLRNLDDFTTFEAESILLQNPLIYTKYGNISLENCSFINTYSQFLLDVEEAENILLKELSFIKTTLKKSPLIRLSLRQQQKGSIMIQNIQILQNKQIESLDNIQCLTKQFLILLPKLQCPNTFFSLKKLQFLIKDNKSYLENQFFCNLKTLNNIKNIQYSLMEIINVENKHLIQILGLKFENNVCQECYYGLMKVTKSDASIKQLLKINNLEILRNVCGYSGCFSFFGKSQSNPFRSDLISGRILLVQNIENLTEKIKYDIFIENSKFLYNTGQFGGAIMIFEAQSLIYNCEFKFNTAKIGGAIYYFADSKLLILIQSKINHNSAKIAGGIFLNNQSLQELYQLSVDVSENNSTEFGFDFVESPRSLSIIVSENQIQLEKKIVNQSTTQIFEKIIVRPYKTFGYKNQLQILTLPSGRSIGSYYYFDSDSLNLIPYNLTFRIIPLNKFNKQIKGLDGHSCNITPVAINQSSNTVINDKFYALSYYSTLYNKETQDFNFDDLVIYFNPNYDDNLLLRLIIKCDFIQIPVYDEQPPFLIIDYIKNYQLWVEIKTFQCQLGEYLNVTSGGCVLCNSFQNQYQVSWNAQNCSYKDDLKMKSIESSMIELRPHYWRAYYYSSTIENCYHLEENCQGGWIPGDDSCMLGHVGALCEQCDLYNIRGDGSFSVSSTYSCGSCDKIAVNVLSIILISLWTLISTLMSVQSTVQMMEEFIIELKMKQFRVIIGLQTASTAILIKVVTNYLQIISTISTFQLQIPVGLQTTFNSVGNPIEQMAYSLDCFLITISDIDIIYFRIIWSVLMAIFYITIFLIIGVFGKLINKIKFSISHISTALLYIFIFMQPSLIQGLISSLSFRIISDEFWVQGNVAYRYDTYQHLNWSIGFSLPLLIFIGCLLPFLFWYGLFKNRNNLDKIIVRKVWGYLYNEYKQQSYYWETIKILQKEFIIIVLVYYDDYIPIKASLVFLILFGYSYSTQQSKPYTTGELNYLDSQSTIVCAVSIILGSSIFLAQQNNFQEIVWPFYIIIALLNLLFISQMILKIIFAYFQKLSEKIDKIKELISKRFSSFIVVHPSLNKLFELNSDKQARIKQKYKKIREKLMPQIKKLLQYKRNNSFWSSVFDDHRKEIYINSCDEFQVLSFYGRKCQSSIIDQYNSNRITENVKPQKVYPVNDLIQNDLNQQY